MMKKGIVNRAQVFGAKGLDERDFPDPAASPPPLPSSSTSHSKTQPALFSEDAAEGKEHVYQDASLEALTLAEEEDDGGALDDDAAMSKFRAARMKEWKERLATERFGSVEEIGKEDWVREVTEGSKAGGKGSGGEGGLWVVVHLYQDRVEDCRVLEEVLRAVAAKFKAVKFLKIRSTSAIENWPDRNLPTLFVYRDGELRTQMLGLKKVGGKKAQARDLEWWLAQAGVVETEMEEDPREEEGRERRREGWRAREGRWAHGEEDED